MPTSDGRAVDKLVYSVVVTSSVSTVSMNKYFVEGDVNEQVNNVPSARFKFDDEDGIIETLIPPTNTYYVKFSASRDGGKNWVPLFSGLIENYNISVEPSGERYVEVSAYGGHGLRYSYATPNQMAVGPYESMSTLLTGTPTDSSGIAWNADAQSNYPNGYLYDTGYSYDSAYSKNDFFTDVPDLPNKLGFGSRRKLEMLRSVLEPYSAVFFLRDGTTPPKFILKNSPKIESFSAISYSFKIGKDVNSFRRNIDMQSYRPLITIIGDPERVWSQYGSGSIEEMFVDSDVTSYEAAYTNARQLWSVSQLIDEDIAISVLPPTKSIMGTTVKVEDVNGTVYTRSVVGIRHQLEADRWITNLQVSIPGIDTVQTVAEIQAALENQKEEDIKSQAYVRVFGQTNSFYAGAGNSCRNLVAVGIGSNSGSSPTSYSAMIAPIAVSMLDSYLDPDTTYSRGEVIPSHSKGWTRFGNDVRGRVKEIALFANDLKSGSLYKITQSYDWNRPTTEWSATGYTLIGTTTGGRHLLSVSEVNIISTNSDQRAYYFTAAKADGKLCETGSAVGLPSSIPSPISTDSAWNSPSYAKTLKKTLASMSRDLAMTTTAFDVAIYSGSQSAATCFIPLTFLSFPTPWENEGTFSEKIITSRYLKDIKFVYLAKGEWVDDSSVTRSNQLNIAVLSSTMDTPASGVWVTNSDANWTVASSSQVTLSYKTISLQALGFTMSDFISDAGRFNLVFFNTPSAWADNTGKYLQYIGYAGVVYEVGSWSNLPKGYDEIFEKVQFNDRTGAFHFSLPPKQIIGMWKDATSTDFGFVPIGPDLSLWFKTEELTLEGTNQFWDVSNPGHYEVRHSDRGYSFKVWKDWKWTVNFAIDDETPLFDIANQGYAWIAYRTSADWVFNDPPKLSPDVLKTIFNPSDYGITSIVSLSMWNAPVYTTKIELVYDAVADNNVAHGGVISRATLSSDQTWNSIREGIDMNGYKTLNVLFDLDITSTAGSNAFAGAGGNYGGGNFRKSYL